MQIPNRFYLTIRNAKKILATDTPYYTYNLTYAIPIQVPLDNIDFLKLDMYLHITPAFLKFFRNKIDRIKASILQKKKALRDYKPLTIDQVKVYYSDYRNLLTRLMSAGEVHLHEVLSKTPPKFFLTLSDIHKFQNKEIASLTVANEHNVYATIRMITREKIDEIFAANDPMTNLSNTLPPMRSPLSGQVHVTHGYTLWLMSTVFVIEDYLMARSDSNSKSEASTDLNIL